MQSALVCGSGGVGAGGGGGKDREVGMCEPWNQLYGHYRAPPVDLETFFRIKQLTNNADLQASFDLAENVNYSLPVLFPLEVRCPSMQSQQQQNQQQQQHQQLLQRQQHHQTQEQQIRNHQQQHYEHEQQQKLQQNSLKRRQQRLQKQQLQQQMLQHHLNQQHQQRQPEKRQPQQQNLQEQQRQQQQHNLQQHEEVERERQGLDEGDVDLRAGWRSHWSSSDNSGLLESFEDDREEIANWMISSAMGSDEHRGERLNEGGPDAEQIQRQGSTMATRPEFGDARKHRDQQHELLQQLQQRLQQQNGQQQLLLLHQMLLQKRGAKLKGAEKLPMKGSPPSSPDSPSSSSSSSSETTRNASMSSSSSSSSLSSPVAIETSATAATAAAGRTVPMTATTATAATAGAVVITATTTKAATTATAATAEQDAAAASLKSLPQVTDALASSLSAQLAAGAEQRQPYQQPHRYKQEKHEEEQQEKCVEFSDVKFKQPDTEIFRNAKHFPGPDRQADEGTNVNQRADDAPSTSSAVNRHKTFTIDEILRRHDDNVMVSAVMTSNGDACCKHSVANTVDDGREAGVVAGCQQLGFSTVGGRDIMSWGYRTAGGVSEPSGGLCSPLWAPRGVVQDVSMRIRECGRWRGDGRGGGEGSCRFVIGGIVQKNACQLVPDQVSDSSAHRRETGLLSTSGGGGEEGGRGGERGGERVEAGVSKGERGIVCLQSWKQSRSKRVRTIFTTEQLQRLEEQFERQQYMVGTERYYLATSLRLTESQVKVWFQNRRIKWRKQCIERQHAKLSAISATRSHDNYDTDDDDIDDDEDYNDIRRPSSSMSSSSCGSDVSVGHVIGDQDLLGIRDGTGCHATSFSAVIG